VAVNAPPFEVADVIRGLAGTDGTVPGLRVSSRQQRVMTALAACRTAKLGGHVDACGACGELRVSYNSCRDRHCPKCLGPQRARWLAARCADLLPVPYFHLVFTLPAELAPLALQNQRLVYGALFAAVAQTLETIAADPKHLGARIGFIAVLHTWGQTLVHHPHVHCVIPGGGLSADGRRWVRCRERFFLPVRVLSRLYRGKLLAALRAAFDGGRLELHGQLSALAEPGRFGQWCRRLRDKEWVVYAKRPFGGPAQVLGYLARYTHRVAIANHRITEIRDGSVSFRYRDYAHGNRERVMTLGAVEFLRRFLQHVLPERFVRIRHYGLLANRCRRTQLSRCRELIAAAGDDDHDPAELEVPSTCAGDDDDRKRCPKCGARAMRRVGSFERQPTWVYEPGARPFIDTS
jgi:hypothetical protein